MLNSWLFTAAGRFVHLVVHIPLCTEKRQNIRDSFLNYEVLQRNVFPVLDAIQNLFFFLAPESFLIPVVDTNPNYLDR